MSEARRGEDALSVMPSLLGKVFSKDCRHGKRAFACCKTERARPFLPEIKVRGRSVHGGFQVCNVGSQRDVHFAQHSEAKCGARFWQFEPARLEQPAEEVVVGFRPAVPRPVLHEPRSAQLFLVTGRYHPDQKRSASPER